MIIYKPVTALNVVALEDCPLPDSAKALDKLYIDSQQIHSQRTNSVVSRKRQTASVIRPGAAKTLNKTTGASGHYQQEPPLGVAKNLNKTTSAK